MKRILAPVFLLAVLLCGCSSSDNVVSVGLRIELNGVERAADGTVQVSWQVANPNVVPYLVSHTTLKVYLDGAYLGMANDEEPLGVAPSSHAGRTSRLSGGDAAAAQAVAAAGVKGSGNYRVDSVVVLRLYDEAVQRALFSNSGTVPVTAK